MKRLLSVILTAVVFVSVLSMSGCDDFGFNPTGSWKLTKDTFYLDGEYWYEDKPGYIGSEEEGYAYIGNMIYKFGKSGVGSIYMDDTYIQDFTFDYEKEEITVHMSDPKNKYGTKNFIYKAGKDKDGNETLTRTDIETANDDEGDQHELREEFIFTRQ
ncbi:MAG: hypothetical protein IJ192_01845 [Clostridia bacterium]|nr:hypothetical protein [Clostridia bacterium]